MKCAEGVKCATCNPLKNIEMIQNQCISHSMPINHTSATKDRYVYGVSNKTGNENFFFRHEGQTTKTNKKYTHACTHKKCKKTQRTKNLWSFAEYGNYELPAISFCTKISVVTTTASKLSR